MKTNVAKKKEKEYTHEGGPAHKQSDLSQLKRAVFACLLWEDNFYENGVSISDRIKDLCKAVDSDEVAAIADQARNVMQMRHVPLLLTVALAGKRYDKLEQVVTNVIRRADEMGELLALYWADDKKPIPAGMKRGLARVFGKFDAYALGKYNRDGAIKLRDILRLVHPTPKDEAQSILWKRLLAGDLASPDIWEVELSAGKDKKATFTRLLSENKLGYMALLRNLRNMEQAGVDKQLVKTALLSGNASRVLPFRYIAASRACPAWAAMVDDAFKLKLASLDPVAGETVFMVDVSGSMDSALSKKSDLLRMDAAAALAAIWPGEKRIFTFSERLVEVPSYAGLAAIDQITKSQDNSGTYLGQSLRELETKLKTMPKRLIVITDEQSADRTPQPYAEHGYVINVASEKPSIAYGPWVSLTGFSENILKYIAETENK